MYGILTKKLDIWEIRYTDEKFWGHYATLNSNPPFFLLSQDVIRFHELPADTWQHFLQ